MKYFPPIKVISPTEYVSNVKVLYDGGDDSVSVASLEWEGNPCIAMRWNIARREWDDSEKIKNKKTCVGMPSSHGYPVWFILPEELFDSQSDLNKAIKDFLMNHNNCAGI